MDEFKGVPGFDTPASAVIWADNLLRQPNCKSQMGKILKRHILHGSKGDPQIGSDRQDFAETISASLSEVRSPPGSLYRYIYGHNHGHARLNELSAILSSVVSLRTGTEQQRRCLSMLALMEAKERLRYDRRYTITKMAKKMEVKRQAFYEQFGETLGELRRIIAQWHDEANRALSLLLVERGIMK